MENPFVASIPRMIHQLTIALWLGALIYVILLLIWQQKQNATISWKEFRPFFVNKMVLASGLVLLSGVVLVYLQTGVVAVFTDWKTWSTAVIIKLILTFTMLGLALFQTLKWKKTEKFATRSWIRVEWIIGLVAIIFGVWMSQIAYPVAVKTYDEVLKTDGAEAEITISKLQAGDQKMIVALSELNGKKPEEVSIRISIPQHDMNGGTQTAEQDDSGDYTFELPFSMAGTWLLEITATYPDGKKIEWEDEVFIAGKGN